MTTDDLAQARQHVQSLLSGGMTHTGIAEALGGRVSARTVYRWAKGENAPQRRADLVALEQLAKQHAPA
jgi:transposase